MSIVAVSVVIPVYNGERLIGAAIRSVLEQTCTAFEVIVVDDASTDGTAQAVAAIRDPRVCYLVHDANRGLHAARNTGIRATRAEIVAFLDHDDLFHPDKLQAHVQLLTKERPDVGFSYNTRFELNYRSETIREIWLPPAPLGLADCVLGYPVAPSEMVIRKRWLYAAGLWEEAHGFFGGEIILTGRLHFAGCTFARIDRALNYRRHHPGRVYADIAGSCRMEIEAQERILSDTRCPTDVVGLRAKAASRMCFVWAYHALAQEETAVGQRLLREGVGLDPTALLGDPPWLLQFLIDNSVSDEGANHAALLRLILAQLPSEAARLREYQDAAVARGHLIKAMRAVLWQSPEVAEVHVQRAMARQAVAADWLLGRWVHQLMLCERVLGAAAARAALEKSVPPLVRVGGPAAARRLRAQYWAARAFLAHQDGPDGVAPAVLQAFRNQPRLLTNRGLWSILMRSIRPWPTRPEKLGGPACRG